MSKKPTQTNTLAQTHSQHSSEVKQGSQEIVEESNPEDNMSLAEIVALRYKSKIKVNKLKTPEDAASILIKDTKEFDVNDNVYTMGTTQE